MLTYNTIIFPFWEIYFVFEISFSFGSDKNFNLEQIKTKSISWFEKKIIQMITDPCKAELI